MSNSFKIINAIVFQIGWFICILTTNTISLAFTFLFVVGNFFAIYFFTGKFSLKTEVSWLLLCLALGLIYETIFINSGILYQTGADTLAVFGGVQLPPAWLLCLWVVFAVIMRTSMTFIFNKPLLTCLLTLAVAPCNYYAGAGLNSQVDIGQPLLLNLSLLGLTWAFAMACLITVYNLHFKDA